METANLDRIGRLPDVQSLTGIRRSTIYTRIKEGLLPPPVSIGRQARGWPLREIVAVNEARIAGKSEEQIRELVATLVERRKAAA